LTKEIYLSPVLLDSMNILKVENIAIGSGELSVTVRRNGDSFEVAIDKNTTGYEIVLQ
jgi:hypothetical protein